MTKVRGFSKGTHQYLTFTKIGHHPIVRSESGSFLTTRFVKYVAVDGQALREMAR